jgi:hypothetical protein
MDEIDVEEIASKENIVKKVVSAYIGITLYRLKKDGTEVKQDKINKYIQKAEGLENYLGNSFLKDYGSIQNLFENLRSGEISSEEALEISKKLNKIADEYVRDLAKIKGIDSTAERVRIQSSLLEQNTNNYMLGFISENVCDLEDKWPEVIDYEKFEILKLLSFGGKTEEEIDKEYGGKNVETEKILENLHSLGFVDSIDIYTREPGEICDSPFPKYCQHFLTERGKQIMEIVE